MKSILALPSMKLGSLSAALEEIDKINKQIVQAIKHAKTEEEEKQIINKIFQDAEKRLDKILNDEEVEKSNHGSLSFEELVDNLFKAVDEKNEKENDIFTFSEIVEQLKDDEMATSVEYGGVQIIRAEDGSLSFPNNEPVQLSKYVLKSNYTISKRFADFEIVAVPMHVALEVFQQGETIIIEYKDTSLEIDPNVSENERPNIHFDAIVNGMYYVKKSK